MDNRLLPFLAKVGTGEKGAKDLSYDEAREAMTAILDGAFHPVTLGAFLVAERWKPETAAELAAFADALAERLQRPALPRSVPGLLDCAGAYDGKTRTLNIGIPAALVAAGAGVPVLLHGAKGIPTKAGMTPAHVLARLGIAPLRTPDEALSDLERGGIAYLHQPAFHPSLHALLASRIAVGKRTFLNTIEPLVNPLGAAAHVGGFFHRPFGERICHALNRSNLGFARAVMVEGIEGSDEIRPGRAAVAELRDGEVRTYPVESAALGLTWRMSDVAASSVGAEAMATESALRIRAVLRGEDRSGYRNAVLLNAALRIYASGRAATWEEGALLARRSLDSGEPWERLQRWRGDGRPTAVHPPSP